MNIIIINIIIMLSYMNKVTVIATGAGVSLSSKLNYSNAETCEFQKFME